MKLTIVLTGTIRPQVKGGAWSVDEREKMYLSTLKYYSEKIGHKYPIVFVENSDLNICHWGGCLQVLLILRYCSIHHIILKILTLTTHKVRGIMNS